MPLTIIVARWLIAITKIKCLVCLVLNCEVGRQQATIICRLTVTESFFYQYFKGVALLDVIEKINVPGKDICKLNGQ